MEKKIIPEKPLTPEQVALKGSMKNEKVPRGKKKNYNTRDEKAANLLASKERIKEKYVRTDEQLLAVAKRLREFAKNPESILFSDFYELEEISKQVFARWEERCPELKEAHEWAMLCIGNHREKGGLLKKLDFNVVKQKQHQYDQDWRDADKYHSDLKANSEKNSSDPIKYIVIPESPKADKYKK